MISYLLAGPAEEPVSLAETKAFLRLDGVAEDGLVASLIAAARLHVEAVTGRALVRQSWRVVLDAWPDELRVPVSPVIEVTTARAFDEQDDEHELDVDAIQIAGDRLLLPATMDGMQVLRPRLGIELDYVAGFGDAGDVPPDLKQAVLALVAHWFEHRDLAVVDAVAPAGFDRLVAGHRQVRL
ncbi:head-tail connector protein [Devosia sp. CN2-171]|uniref:head-tail connector protein n=1 Tax=Devosia sp. CN2-171 TaxID=3400909 RepID=UPI003BF9029C